jgi:hypothetical protein
MVRGLTLMPIRDASDSRDDLIGGEAQQKKAIRAERGLR